MVRQKAERSYIIHLHPQMAYIARCIIDIIQREIHPHSQPYNLKIYLLYAPTFLDHINAHCIDYLASSKLLENLTKQFPFLSFRYIKLNLVNVKSQFVIPDSLRQLFNDSVLDSIYRDLTPGLNSFDYYNSPPLGRSKIEKDRTDYALRLSESFTSLFDALQPVGIYFSHSHYDHYIAPIVSALTKSNINVSIFHSGYFTSYRLCDTSYTNISPTIPLSSLVNPFHLINDDITSLTNSTTSRLLKVDRTYHIKTESLQSVLISYKEAHVLNPPKCKRFVIVALPTLKELTSWYHTNRRLFRNRYDFMKFTLENIEDSADCIVVVRPHPQYKNYNEESHIHDILSQCNAGRHYPFTVLESNSELFNLLCDTSPSWDDIQIITSDGSVVLELGQLGSKIVCTQQTYGDPSAYYLPSSLSTYSDFIKGIDMGDFSNINNSSKIRSCLYSNIFNLSLLKRPDSNYGDFILNNIGDFYHFGQTKGDPSVISNLFITCVHRFQPRSLSFQFDLFL